MIPLNRFRNGSSIFLGFALTALLLAWVSTGSPDFSAWAAFLLVILLGAAAGALVFRALREEALPSWLISLTVGAALLRILAGAAWFSLLPTYGYETDVQQAGYVMEDAFTRDRAAWDLSESEEPLLAAFRSSEFDEFRNADQYGGLLFISAAVYRYSGAAVHMPLLIVVLAAAASALVVPLGWAFSARFFDAKTARWAAWGLALYPEAILLGSSQMREAWIKPLAAAAPFGLAVYAGRNGPASPRKGLLWLLGALILMVPISPPFAGILVGLLALVGLGLFRQDLRRNWRLWAGLAVLALVAAAAVWLGWSQIAPRVNAAAYDNPLELAAAWLRDVGRWQAYLSEASSGWLQKIFDNTPEWANIPFLIGYGVTRPLLPAQLVATGVPIWTAIGIWRAAGWTALLFLLLYAPFQALRARETRPLLISLSLAVWAGILFASFWGGGDQWDNPRYRVAFIAPQIVLAAKVLVEHGRKPDPWMRRILLVAGAMLAWFLPWYLRRYTGFEDVFGWSMVDIFKLLAAGLLTGVLLAVWDWARTPGEPV